MKNRLSLLFIHYNMTCKGGTERVLTNLSEALSKYFDIHIISISGGGKDPYFPLDKSVKYTTLFDGDLRIRNVVFSAGKKIRQYINNNSIDMAFAIGGRVAFFLWDGCRKTKAKQIFCEHINLTSALKSPSNAPLRWIAAKTADKIITLTDKDRENYIKHYSINPDRVMSIPNWIDPKLFEINSEYDANSKKLITVGRLSPDKGFDYLVEVAKEVLSKHSDYTWDIWGSGDEFENIKASISKAGLEQKLVLKGTTENLYSLYPEYAMYVMTSRVEGLPMVLLEAKACGLPIVSFDCPTGPSDILQDGIDGYLIPNFDTKLMAEKINELIESTEKRIEFSAHTKDNFNKFEKETIVNEWVRFIEEFAKE